MSGYVIREPTQPGGKMNIAGASAFLIALGASLLVVSNWVQTPTSLYSTGVIPTTSVVASNRVPMELYGKGRGGGRRASMQKKMMGPTIQKPPTPPVDPDNEEFVLFARAKGGDKWLPLTIVTGGTNANNLVKATQGTLATEMFQNQLVRSIGEVIYRDQDKIENQIRSIKVPGLSAIKQFEYGFKIRDKTNPDAWMDDTGVIVIPPKDELPTTPLNKIADGVKGLGEKLGIGKKDGN